MRERGKGREVTQTDGRTHACTHARTHARTDTHTHTHTHTHTQSQALTVTVTVTVTGRALEPLKIGLERDPGQDPGPGLGVRPRVLGQEATVRVFLQVGPGRPVRESSPSPAAGRGAARCLRQRIWEPQPEIGGIRVHRDG